MNRKLALTLSLTTLVLIIGSNQAFSQYENRWVDEFDAFSSLDSNLTITPIKIIS